MLSLMLGSTPASAFWHNGLQLLPPAVITPQIRLPVFPQEATGAPDVVPSCGDNAKAWAPSKSEDIPEYLLLNYDIAVKAPGGKDL